MIQKKFEEAANDFIRFKLEPFTVEEFRKHMKSQKIKISIEEAHDILLSSDYVFGLVNDFFLTRAGAFTNQLFSFKPKKEEVEQGGFIGGHRFMPFIDPALNPYDATLVFQGEEVPKTEIELNTNTVLDLHALFGEGFIIPLVLSDPAIDEIRLKNVQYGLPKYLNVTAFSLDPYIEQGFRLGDRILCKVVDWDKMIIETQLQKRDRNSLKITKEDLEREEWYTAFENAFTKKMEKCGPTTSIEQQLAFLFLEEQKTLCVELCGSCSEFLEHTSNLDFVPYGIESRIWKADSEIPFLGAWNSEILEQRLLPNLTLVFADTTMDSYIKDNFYRTDFKGDIQQIFDAIFPKSLKIDDFERQFTMLHLQKRIDIVKKKFSRFVDYPIVSLRRTALLLFTRVSELMWMVGDAENRKWKLEDLPQQELITLSQLLGHVSHILEEIELEPDHAGEEKEDILTSLDGLGETFEGVEILLLDALRSLKSRK